MLVDVMLKPAIACLQGRPLHLLITSISNNYEWGGGGGGGGGYNNTAKYQVPELQNLLKWHTETCCADPVENCKKTR